jgi:hypothetical protein
MIGSHVAICAVVAAATLAGCFTYLVRPAIAPVGDNQRPGLGKLILSAPGITVSKGTDLQSVDNENAATAYLEAAQAILRRTPSAQASVSADEIPITARIPLPRKRPIPRP